MQVINSTLNSTISIKQLKVVPHICLELTNNHDIFIDINATGYMYVT